MIGVLARFAWGHLSGVGSALDALRGLSEERDESMVATPRLVPEHVAGPQPRTGHTYSVAEHGYETSVLDDLADLTATRGSWDAARTLFATIDERTHP